MQHMHTPSIYAYLYVMQTHRALTRTQNSTRGPILFYFLGEQEGGLLVGIYVQCMNMNHMYSIDPSSSEAQMVSVRSR